MLPLAVAANTCSTFFLCFVPQLKLVGQVLSPASRAVPRDRLLRRGTQEPSLECIEGRRNLYAWTGVS